MDEGKCDFDQEIASRCGSIGWQTNSLPLARISGTFAGRWERACAGGATVNPGKCRWRCPSNDTASGSRWRGSRGAGLRSRPGERGLRLPL